MRNQGKSISEYTAKYINSRTKFFFFLIVFLELWIVIAIFGLIIAIIFAMYPATVLPVWCEIPIAVTLGYMIYKKGASIMTWSIVAVVVMYITVFIGAYVPMKMPAIAGIPPTGVWDHHSADICVYRVHTPGHHLAAAPGFYQLPPAGHRHGPADSRCYRIGFRRASGNCSTGPATQPGQGTAHVALPFHYHCLWRHLRFSCPGVIGDII